MFNFFRPSPKTPQQTSPLPPPVTQQTGALQGTPVTQSTQQGVNPHAPQPIVSPKKNIGASLNEAIEKDNIEDFEAIMKDAVEACSKCFDTEPTSLKKIIDSISPLLRAKAGFMLLCFILKKKCNNDSLLIFLFKKFPDLKKQINDKNTLGETPLCLATAGGCLKDIEYLIQLGADPKICNSKGDAPLDLVIKPQDNNTINEHRSILKILLSPLSQKERMFYENAFRLISKGSHRIPADVIRSPEFDLNFQNHKGKTLLHLFISFPSHSRLIGEILPSYISSDGKNIALQDHEGNTPLHSAVKYSIQIENLLWISMHQKILPQSDLTRQDKQGNTVLDLILQNSAIPCVDTAFVDILRAKVGPFDKLNHFRSVFEIMQTCVNPSLHEAFQTLLLRGIIETSCDIVTLRLLLSHFPSLKNMNRKDSEGQTPFHWLASTKLEPEQKCCMMTFLCQCGANINEKDFKKQTPLHILASQGELDCMVYLLNSSEASIHAKDHQDQTPLHIAVSEGNATVVSLLLKHGAKTSIEEKDFQGRTALDIARTLTSQKERRTILALLGETQ